MALERTFSIIKPDAVAKNVIGAIYNRFESAGLRIVASKMIHMSKEQAEGFYAEHKERPFFGALVDFMTLRQSTKTQFTVLTHLSQQHVKLLTSSLKKKSAHVLAKIT